MYICYIHFWLLEVCGLVNCNVKVLFNGDFNQECRYCKMKSSSGPSLADRHRKLVWVAIFHCWQVRVDIKVKCLQTIDAIRMAGVSFGEEDCDSDVDEDDDIITS